MAKAEFLLGSPSVDSVLALFEAIKGPPATAKERKAVEDEWPRANRRLFRAQLGGASSRPKRRLSLQQARAIGDLR
jgi:hypothetical protein